MVLAVIGLITVIAFGAGFMLRSRGQTPQEHSRQKHQKTKTNTRAQHTPRGPYAAVSVNPCNTPCAAALDTSNLRYLASAAPSLPLSGCNQSSCQCSFTHHQDRRGNRNEDRRIGIGLQTELYGASGETNRREKQRGRRAGDRS